MTMRNGFNLHHSDLQEFLLTPIWDEKNGLPLSILSALARLGMDPWGEAARLADMPRAAAASTLATILARLPRNDPGLPDYAGLSQHLVQFLPESGTSPSHNRHETDQPGTGRRWNQRIASGSRNASVQNVGLILALVVLVILQVGGWLF